MVPHRVSCLPYEIIILALRRQVLYELKRERDDGHMAATRRAAVIDVAVVTAVSACRQLAGSGGEGR